jgi:hypothetical protein
MSTRTETVTLSGEAGCCCETQPSCECLFTGCLEVTSVDGLAALPCTCTVSEGAIVPVNRLLETPPVCFLSWSPLFSTSCGGNDNVFNLTCENGVYTFSPSTSFGGDTRGPTVVSVRNSPFRIIIELGGGYFCTEDGLVTVTIEEVPCP